MQDEPTSHMGLALSRSIPKLVVCQNTKSTYKIKVKYCTTRKVNAFRNEGSSKLHDLIIYSFDSYHVCNRNPSA